jgi:predicted dehydrogenase
MSVGLGIIGLGVQGRRMLARLGEHGGVRAVAAWDPDASRLEGTGLEAAGSAEALVRMPGVDCVFIASPPAVHLAQANLAFDAGKAVFCEKPLSTNADEARATIARIEREGRRAAVNFSLAGSAGLESLLTPFVGDELGKPLAVEIEVAFRQWPRPWQAAAGPWLAERREGGFTREVLSHFVFVLQRLLGQATVEKSVACYPGDGVHAEAGLVAELRASGVPVRIEGDVGGEIADFNRFALVGEHRTVEFRDWLATRDGHPVQSGGRPGYLRQLDQLVAFVEGRPHLLPDFAEALAVQETIEAMLAGK